MPEDTIRYKITWEGKPYKMTVPKGTTSEDALAQFQRYMNPEPSPAFSRFFTEGLPKATETFVGAMSQPREGFPKLGIPPPQKMHSKNPVLEGLASLARGPVALSEDLVRAFGVAIPKALAEIGPEQAKPLTEALTNIVLGGGPKALTGGFKGSLGGTFRVTSSRGVPRIELPDQPLGPPAPSYTVHPSQALERYTGPAKVTPTVRLGGEGGASGIRKGVIPLPESNVPSLSEVLRNSPTLIPNLAQQRMPFRALPAPATVLPESLTPPLADVLRGIPKPRTHGRYPGAPGEIPPTLQPVDPRIVQPGPGVPGSVLERLRIQRGETPILDMFGRQVKPAEDILGGGFLDPLAPATGGTTKIPSIVKPFENVKKTLRQSAPFRVTDRRGFGNEGKITGRTVAQLAGAVSGGIAGGEAGNSPEERLVYALLGAGLGAVGVRGITSQRLNVSSVGEAWRKVGSFIKEKLPQDYFIWKVRPNSGAVTSAEQGRAYVDKLVQGMTEQPAFSAVENPQVWKDAEHTAYQAAKAAGGNWNAGFATLPQHIQDAVMYLKNVIRPAEEAAAKLLGAEALKSEPLYYLPHVVEKDLDDVIQLTRKFSGLNNDYRSTLGAFNKERTFPTMTLGETAAGSNVTYANPQQALLWRMWAGTKLAMTGKFVEQLEKSGTLFRSDVLAKGASPVGKAYQVEGIPGSVKWWAPTKEEARFIHDQLVDPHVFGALSSVNRFGNAVFRNMNLWNPWPHFLKNMLVKYGFSSPKQWGRVFKDMQEFRKSSDPAMLKEYQEFMPYNPSGRSAHEMMFDMNKNVKGWTTPENVWHGINAPNRWSAKTIFGRMDPAIKYSRYKQYREMGKSTYEAASQTHLDLVRYGVRSAAVDTWKAIPFNFFVPWRVGTITSLMKNSREIPLRAGIFVTSLDVLREAMYRTTGNWVHLPIDYFEGPVVDTIQEWYKHGTLRAAGGKLQGGLPTALMTVAGTLAAGPGAEQTGKLYRNMASMIYEKNIDWRAIQNAFWGFALVGDSVSNIKHLAELGPNPEPKKLLNMAGELIGSASVAMHSALNKEPHRPGALIPEVIIPKSANVKTAETRQRVIEHMRERRLMKPRRPSITETLRGY